MVPAEPGYWPPADREIILTLDDLLIEEGRIAPFHRDQTSYAAMGRYGNVLLVGGETDPRLAAGTGEVVRLWLTNTRQHVDRRPAGSLPPSGPCRALWMAG